jgi:enoyl-CoA hydratase
MFSHYPKYEGLQLDRPADRVLRITISRGKMNEMDYQLHYDIANIWRYVDTDPETSVAIVTGAGRAFSAGGDFALEEKVVNEQEWRMKMWKDGRDLVNNILACTKPIIAAINGAAAGGGLAVALMADITIAAKKAKIVDPHVKLGVAAGDHAAIIWPLLCGMAKAKYYLMLGDAILGEEAERIGLITMAVEADELQAKAIEIATRLAQGAPSAIRWTKYTMNNWMRAAWPIFDASLALEILGFAGPEVKEGLQALVERRTPRFDPDSPA